MLTPQMLDREARRSAGGCPDSHRLALHDYFPYGEKSTFAYRDRERIKFTGQERDFGLDGQTTDDLDYMHARYYTFHLGRFLSVDPVGGSVGSAQSWNRYAYALNNPLRHTDPWGLDEEDINGTTAGCDQDSAAGDQACASFRSPGENSVASEASLQVASRREERGDPHVWTKENSTGTHQALASLGTFSEEYGLFSKQWKADFISGRYWGTALGEEALEQYAAAWSDPSASVFVRTYSAAGGFFAALWTPETYWRTYGAFTGSALFAQRSAIATGLFGKGGLLNRGPYLRIGWGRRGGRRVFRIAGRWIERLFGHHHIDFWDGGPL